jgi:hypothetical protein
VRETPPHKDQRVWWTKCCRDGEYRRCEKVCHESIKRSPLARSSELCWTRLDPTYHLRRSRRDRKLDHLSTRTTICPHAIEAAALKIHETKLNKKKKVSKAKPRHRAIDYILFTLDSIRDISDNVTPLAKSFCCNILLSSALATPIAWFWNIRILIVDFGSEVRPCCNGDCCTHALTCLSFPICPGTPDLFHHHPDHPVVIIGFLFRQKSLEFCYLPQHCPPRCFRPLYMHRPEPPVNIFRSLFIFHRVPIGYPCTIGYGMDRIWFSMSLHGSLCFQQLMA